jgi:hypothetical protein
VRPSTNPSASQPGANRAQPPANAPRREMTPEEVLERSLNLEDKPAAPGGDGPGPSRFNGGSSGNRSSIGRSRFGTGVGSGPQQ